MENKVPDVTSAPSTEPQVTPDVVAPQTQEGVTPVEPPTTEPTNVPAEEGKIQAEEVDEQGVPWKNRAFEWQRKTQELTENLPKIIEETLQKTMQQQQIPQKKTYTVAELEAFAQENPTYRPWVEEQKAILLQESLNKSLEERFKNKEEEVKKSSLRQQSEQAVVKAFPNMFTKDSMGNTVWNNQDPMTRLVAQYMQDPEIKNHPRGLEVASKMAYSDLVLQGKATQVNTTQKLKAQVKQMEKKVMPEGGGSPVPQQSKTPFKAASERLAQTGSMKDAKDAVAEYFKSLGHIK